MIQSHYDDASILLSWILQNTYDILDIEKCSGNQKFGLAGCEKMAMKETIVSQMRFGMVFDNVLWSKPLVSLP